MKKRYLLFSLFILAISDIVLINISLFLGIHLTYKFLADVDPKLYHHNIWSGTIIWLLSTGIFKLYSYKTIQDLKKVYKSTIYSIALFGVLFIGYIFYTKQTMFPTEVFAALFPLLAMSFITSRMTATAIAEQFPLNMNTEEHVSSIRKFS